VRALQWTAKGAEWPALATAPRACSRPDAAPAAPATLAAGEALFNSPSLLGGQAAKAELSCAACHRSGRDNPHFQMQQLSGPPGTADVSNSFFGPNRANGRFDPVPIPDLARPGKISRAPGDPALSRFIHGLIVEEFSGAEPSAATLGAVTAYVRSIGPCPSDVKQEEPQRLADQLALIDRAIAGTLAVMDSDLDRQLIAASRHQLGLIDERYAGPRLAVLRRDLLAASRDLARIGNETATGARRAALRKWHGEFAARLVPRLQRAEGASLYDPARLRDRLATVRSRPG
jgi:hypothetical protein